MTPRLEIPPLPLPDSVLGQLETLVPTKLPLLIVGPPGTGKSTLAKEIHRRSPRARGPFVPVDCATLASGLAESELMGHVRGAYTGADGSRRGLARMAHQGTLFLDEIGVLPKRDQARLLTLLETDRIRPVGSDRDEHVDLRVVAATNADIVEMARRKEFRADLLDRFAPPFIRLPPLSERIGEMPAIVDRLIVEIAARGLVQLPDGLPRVDEGAVRLLQRQAWPNSIRELRTVLVQALVHGRGRRVGPEQIMVVLRDREARTDTHGSSLRSGPMGPDSEPGGPRRYVRASSPQAERKRVVDALRAAQSKRGAARLLGASRQTVYNRVREFGIQEKEWRGRGARAPEAESGPRGSSLL